MYFTQFHAVTVRNEKNSPFLRITSLSSFFISDASGSAEEQERLAKRALAAARLAPGLKRGQRQQGAPGALGAAPLAGRAGGEREGRARLPERRRQGPPGA